MTTLIMGCRSYNIFLAGLEELREVFVKVDMNFFGRYGDTINQNDGTHLDVGIGIAEDRKMQRLWMRIAKDPHRLYEILMGEIGNCFLKIQTVLFKGVRECHWNSAKPFISAACVLIRESRGLFSPDILGSLLCPS